MSEQQKEATANAEQEQKAPAKQKGQKKTDSKLAEMQKKFEELAGELANQKDSYLRLCAEYDNFRKRSSKEKDEIYSTATVKTVEKLLPIVDNFERAIAAQGDNADQGFSMIYTQFIEVLTSLGITEMETAGEKFDPARQVAVMHIDDKELPENTVVEVFQKGYMLGDKVIRPACVKVAN